MTYQIGTSSRGDYGSQYFARPVLNVTIFNYQGVVGLVDTAAKTCVAGHTLYALLKEKGHPMNSVMKNIILTGRWSS